MVSLLESRTKILIMLISGCLVILLDSPSALLACFLASLLLSVLSRPTLRQIRLLLIFLFFTTWGLLYSQAIFYNEFPRTVLLTLVPAELPFIGEATGGIRIYREGCFMALSNPSGSTQRLSSVFSLSGAHNRATSSSR